MCNKGASFPLLTGSVKRAIVRCLYKQYNTLNGQDQRALKCITDAKMTFQQSEVIL